METKLGLLPSGMGQVTIVGRNLWRHKKIVMFS